MLKPTSILLRNLGFTAPGLLLDQDRAQVNIHRMAGRLAGGSTRFRPHFKTHQSGAVSQWFAEAGITRITVSSLGMAEYFAEFGWTDITLALLVNPLELPRLQTLAAWLDEKGGRLGLTVDSVATAQAVAGMTDLPVDIWLKVDCGYGRTGLAWDDPAALQDVRTALGPNLPTVGLLTHSGHSYQARGRVQLQAIWTQAVDRMQAARASLDPALAISLGDTPGCTQADNFDGVDEIRPGNFVFFDLMQLAIGSCREAELAAAAVCPVLGVYPERGQVVLHGGAVHLSRESLRLPDGRTFFGKLGVLAPDDSSAPDKRVLAQAPVVSLSQEHGVVQIDDPTEFQRLCGRLVPGDLVLVWPVHSCLTCDLHREYRTLDGQVLPRR